MKKYPVVQRYLRKIANSLLFVLGAHKEGS